MKKWEFMVRFVFSIGGLLILAGLYFWFYRVLKYLDSVSIIGQMLPWKLTSMAFLITFVMVAVSGLITAMTTLYYSSDLRFLFSSPVSVRTLFFDKTVETALYASWTLVLVLVPYMLALGRVKHATMLFYVYFFVLMIPFVLLGAASGILLSMILMYFFPTSRTRDSVWVICTLALTLVYMLLRFVKPEKLVRPDTLEVVAHYLAFLQAPTAPYLPSWWVSRGMYGFLYGQYDVFLWYSFLLFATVAGVYGLLIYVSKWVYMKGFSGAQEGRRIGKDKNNPETTERKLIGKGWLDNLEWTLFWKDRLLFVRDVRYWSQLALILAIMAVYLFSIRQMPVESMPMQSVIAFFNIAVAAFVVASIGLRFVFPAISMEGGSLWLLKGAPIDITRIMKEKLLLLSVPSVLVGTILVSWSNTILRADTFISILSVGTIIVTSIVFCVMGIGLGAFFARYNLENIHQIESSAGGFVYMACCFGYIAFILAIEAYAVRTHFYRTFISERVGWDWRWLAISLIAYIALNAAVGIISWKLGTRALEKHEV